MTCRPLLAVLILSFLCACPEPEPDPPGPLEIALTAPIDGLIQADDGLEVTGTFAGGVDPVITVNGQQVTLDAGAGTFSATLQRTDVAWPESPLWPVLAEGADAEGAWLRDRATALFGQGGATGDPIAGAVLARVTDPGLDQLNPLLVDQIESVDLGEAMGGDEPVGTVMGMDIYVNDAGYDHADLELDATVAGLAYVLTPYEVWADLTLDMGFLGTTDGTATATSLVITGLLTLSTEEGDLTATPSGTEVEVYDLAYEGFSDPTGFLDDAINAFFSDELGAEVEEALVEALEGMLEGALRELPFGDIVVGNRFTDVDHDDDGLDIEAESAVELPLEPGGTPPDQRLTTAGAVPEPSGTTTPGGLTYGGAAWLDDDLLNELGVALMAGGYLEQELEGEIGGISLDSSSLAVFVGAFQWLRSDLPMTIRTTGAVPPVATAGGNAGHAARYHLGGLELTFSGDNDADGEDEALLVAATDAIVGIGLDGTSLDTEVDAIDVQVLVNNIGEIDIPTAEEDLEGLVSLAVRLALSQLLDDGFSVFEGLEVEQVEAGADGPDGDRATLWVDFVPVEPDPEG